MRGLAVACLMLLSVTACSVTDPSGAPKQHTVTGTVMVPAEMFAALYQPKQDSLLARVLGFVVPDSWAAVINGNVGTELVPLPNQPLELIRLYYNPATDTVEEFPVLCEGTCQTDVNGDFVLTVNEELGSSLVLRARFIDPTIEPPPVDTIDMRAIVYSTNVDVTPVSEATTQIVIDSLSNFVGFENFTINEVGALVGLVEDMNIDISGQDFTSAVNTIKTEASEVYNSYLLGFMAAGEVNVAKPNDIFHILENRSRLIGANVDFIDGAAVVESSLGGAVSFDSDGNFQNGSAMYKWGLRTRFSGNPERILDQTLADTTNFQLDQNPAGPAYAQYTTLGTPVGFRGIVAGNNGVAIAHSNTESTTAGFISNDGGLMAFLSDKVDPVQDEYDMGLRILMRKWKSITNDYNDQFTFDNNTVNLFDQSTDFNNNTQTSLDLNPLMDQSVYNVILYQNYIHSNNATNTYGYEVGVGTGQWSFSTANQVLMNGGDNASAKPHGQVTVLDLDINELKMMNYNYGIGFGSSAIKNMEPCPNYFMIEEGGSLMLRRDSSDPVCGGLDLNILAGTGAVSSDGEVFVVPQIFDDREDYTQPVYILPNPPVVGGLVAGRRGYYIGLKQMTTLKNAHIAGVYHVVGHLTGIDGGAAESLSYTKVHGSLQFIPSLDDGNGNKTVNGTLYKQTTTMNSILISDAITPDIVAGNVVREAVSGTYNAASNGTFSFTMPGTTGTVTGAAAQLLTLGDGSQVAMFLAIPVVNNVFTNRGNRGLLLLAHEFIVEYPIPPDPPGPPAPPPNRPPTPPNAE